MIGNPPYGVTFNSKEKKEIISKYRTYQYRFESHVYFFEKGIRLLNQSGSLGYITPELWLNLENCEPLREFIYDTPKLAEINVVGENVFIDAVVNTVLTIISKEIKKNGVRINYKDQQWILSYQDWHDTPKKAIEHRINRDLGAIIRKIEKNSFRLKEIGDSIQGITPYDKYRGHDSELIKRRGYHFSFKKDDTCGKWLNGQDINRYSSKWSGE